MICADDVEAGLDRGELRVRYLPTIRLADGTCAGAEALVRWYRDGSVLGAAAFIPAIENTPLSGKLTYWLIDTVAAELGGWLDDHADAYVSINVPPEILGRGGLEYAATHSGLKARQSQVILEVTERGIPDRLGLEALNAMAARGIRLALDDVTLSGVNAALLTRSQFETIKIDHTLVSQLRVDAPPPGWVATLAALLGGSSLHVVAEGIESEYQADVLRRAGVQFGQGHLYSIPLHAVELMAFYDTCMRR